MFQQTYTIFIPKGTVVAEFRYVKGVREERHVEVVGDCYIEDATRDEDGSFLYTVGKHPFSASAGTVQFTANQA